MEEEDTNPELTQFLDKPLEKAPRTVGQQFEDDVDEESEGDEPICGETKNRILSLAATLTHTDPKTYLPLLEKLRNMTENEGQLFLECLQASVNQEAFTGITHMFLETTADLLIHPEDKETKNAMINDPILKKLAASECGQFMLTAGKAGLLFLISFYAFSSWSRRKFQMFARLPGTPAQPPVQNAGSSTQPIGQDNANGKTNAGAVGKAVQ